MKKVIFCLLIAVGLVGCEDYLDKVEDSTGLQEEDVFTNYENFRQFQDRMYKDMHNYLSGGDYSYIAAVSDEGYMTSDWETLPVVQNGDYLRAYNTGQALQFYGIWNAWESIRIINKSLENLDMLEGSSASQDEKDFLKGQAHFMRAWYYYEFLKRQGALPYVTRSYEGTDDFALSRPSYHETVMNVVKDLDTATALLPRVWDAGNTGRPTKGAAMAVKSAALLFNASPTHNPENTIDKWQAAAEASWDLVEFAETTGTYSLIESNGTDQVQYITPDGEKSLQFASGFDSIFLYQPTNKEIIWEHFPSVTNGGMWQVFSVPSIAAGGVIQGFSPSADMVNSFETLDGLDISDDPSYDDQNPYVKRDPRFYHSILFNGERWTSLSGKYLELYNGGEERTGQPHFSTTGYLARKFWGKNVDQWSGAGAPFNHVIYFRLAGILLQYAEAANELGGPNHQIQGASLTAVEAVNRVRARVNMPPVDARYLGSKEAFRERIKNERRVELFLEGKRYFDLKRWGDAHKAEHRQIYAHNFVEEPSNPTGWQISRSTQPVFTLTFDQKNYLWPIPLEDALMFPEFEQNPGW